MADEEQDDETKSNRSASIEIKKPPADSSFNSSSFSSRSNPFENTLQSQMEENYFGFKAEASSSPAGSVAWISENLSKVISNSGKYLNSKLNGGEINPNDLKPSDSQIAQISACEDEIVLLKELILKERDLPRKKELAIMLTNKRMRLNELLEIVEMQLKDGIRTLLSHRFILTTANETIPKKLRCDVCHSLILPLQQFYYCDSCLYHSHLKCLDSIIAHCPIPDPKFEQNLFKICPEKSLAAQRWKCARCDTKIASLSASVLCEFDGYFYCAANCMTSAAGGSDVCASPARVVTNWDFSERRVCRICYLFLQNVAKKPKLNIKVLNPDLYLYVDELKQISTLRWSLSMMKEYVIECSRAISEGFLRDLADARYLIEEADTYSLNDLKRAQSGELLPFVTKLHASFAQHIKSECETCQRRGAYCTECDQDGLLFPFDSHVTQCDGCSRIIHRHCWQRIDKCRFCRLANNNLN